MSSKSVGDSGFVFTPDRLTEAEEIIARYPAGRQASAVLPLLDLAQRQCENWLAVPALEYVASMLGMPFLRVFEVAKFYSMFNLQPVGRHVIQVCTTTPCWLRGSDGIVAACTGKLGIGLGQTSSDGCFTLREVECLGACVNAPVVQIGDHYYEDLTPQHMESLIENLTQGNLPPWGSQRGRRGSESSSASAEPAG